MLLPVFQLGELLSTQFLIHFFKNIIFYSLCQNLQIDIALCFMFHVFQNEKQPVQIQ